MHNQDKFYLTQPEPVSNCLIALRKIILSQDENISETVKWGMPCFCYKKKMFCYLWIDKKTRDPYILFVEGRYLNHPRLETGARSRMKILRINPNRNFPIKIIKELLQKALDLYRLKK